MALSHLFYTMEVMKILRNLIYSVILIVCAVDAQSQFNNQETILKAEDAFVFSSFKLNNTIHVSWQIAPNHYLYKDSIKVFVNDNPLAYTFTSVEDEAMIVDEFFGKSLVLRNTIALQVTLEEYNISTAVIKISYQGCAEGKYCYPRQLKTI